MFDNRQLDRWDLKVIRHILETIFYPVWFIGVWYSLGNVVITVYYSPSYSYGSKVFLNDNISLYTS